MDPRLQIFLDAKRVTDNGDKVHIAGALIRETIFLSFYYNLAATFNEGTWDEFKRQMFDFRLPPFW